MKRLLVILLLWPLALTAQQTISATFPIVVTPTVATPTFSPAAGTYSSTQTVTISTTTPLAVLCYTTDGTTPTESLNLCSGGTTSTYSTPISVATTQTVKAIGTLAGYTDSAVGSATYTISVGPTVIASVCAGGQNGATSAAINTTGATLLVGVPSGLGGSAVALTDNKGNGSATIAGNSYNSGSNITPLIQYWLTPTVGSGHTFTYSAGSSYEGFCVYAVSGVTGVSDNNFTANAITTNTTTCQAGSITPGSGTHIVFASAYDNTTGETPAIGSSYTLPLFLPQSAGNYVGTGAGYLVTGSATNPQWSGFTSQPISCMIMSFH